LMNNDLFFTSFFFTLKWQSYVEEDRKNGYDF
jgi:hypothetical protein